MTKLGVSFKTENGAAGSAPVLKVGNDTVSGLERAAMDGRVRQGRLSGQG